MRSNLVGTMFTVMQVAVDDDYFDDDGDDDGDDDIFAHIS